MEFKDISIQKKLMRVIFLISGVVLLVTCIIFFAYEFYTFRQTTVEKLSAIGKIISANSTAALAFDNQEDAKEILTALKAEPHIVVANLYDKDGNLFSQYSPGPEAPIASVKLEEEGYHFANSHLEMFQQVMQEDRLLGTLYLKSDLEAMYDGFRLYGITTVFVVAISFLLSYILSKILQKSISQPVLTLAETAKAISEHKNYSVRAVKLGNDELGSLTDAFNNMLVQIHEQNLVLSEFSQNLEQKVKERTAELEAANKELDSFSYSVSHDLRAPLRGIHSYAKILEEDYKDRFDEDGKKSMGVILKNSKKMGELIDDLLAFAKLGKKEITHTYINMNSLARSTADEFLALDNENKIELTIQTLPPASGDTSLIKQVWINLISNAVKYSRGTKTIIQVGYMEKENKNIYYVKDNGVGFNMEYYSKLFGVFQRLHSQEEFEGTGVGLAIVQRILQRHQGDIWAESKVNEGSAFYFSLPKVTWSQRN